MEAFPISHLPAEIKTYIFGILDVKSLSNTIQVCKEWNMLIGDNMSLWKELCWRDWNDFLTTRPLEIGEKTKVEIDEEKAKRSRDLYDDYISTTSSSPDDSDEDENIDFIELGMKLKPESNKNEVNDENGTKRLHVNKHVAFKRAKSGREENGSIQNISDWKQFYRDCYQSPNLNGVWIGFYGAHGEEEIQVTQKGYVINAIKITGDVNVPAGKPTWNVRLYSDRKKGKGEIHLADTGYVNPRWGNASITILDENHFHICWPFSSLFQRHVFTLEFKRKGVVDATSNSSENSD